MSRIFIDKRGTVIGKYDGYARFQACKSSINTIEYWKYNEDERNNEGLFHGIPDIFRIDKWEKTNAPFEYNDFMRPDILDDKNEVQRRIDIYTSLKRDRRTDTLHGPFLDIAVHSMDSMIRRASEFRIRQACDIACRLNVRAMIVHTGLISNFYDKGYRAGWLGDNEKFYTKLLKDYPDLWIYMENMFDEEPDSLAVLAERMQGQRFAVTLDIAHAHISKTPVQIWHDRLNPYIMHYHLNDNGGKVDEHKPAGEGNIDWKNIFPMLKKDATKLIEVRTLEDYAKSKEYFLKQ